MSSADGFKIRVSLTKQDIETALKSQVTPLDRVLAIFKWMGLALAGILILSGVANLTGEKILGFLALVGYLVAVKIALNQRFQKMRDELMERVGQFEINYDSDGVRRISGRTETKFGWEDVENLERTPEMLEIKMRDKDVFHIRSTAFDDLVEFNATCDLVTGWAEQVVKGHG